MKRTFCQFFYKIFGLCILYMWMCVSMYVYTAHAIFFNIIVTQCIWHNCMPRCLILSAAQTCPNKPKMYFCPLILPHPVDIGTRQQIILACGISRNRFFLADQYLPYIILFLVRIILFCSGG